MTKIFPYGIGNTEGHNPSNTMPNQCPHPEGHRQAVATTKPIWDDDAKVFQNDPAIYIVCTKCGRKQEI